MIQTQIQTQYDETLRYIQSLGMYSKKKAVDLKKMRYLCALFDNPQESFDIIHVAGTNGKGSTVTMLCNILIEAGYKTGKFISPCIQRFNERIAIDNCDISDEDFVFYANLIINKTADSDENLLPNEFEFITLIAFLHYEKCGCDIVVLETGLGGRLDPTNVIKNPLASVIAAIGLDHTAILGDTLEKIASEKCGIIKENSLTVLYPLNDSVVTDIAELTANKKNNAVIIPDISQIKILEETLEYTRFIYKQREYKIKLIGRHQIYNAVVAVETILTLADCGKLRAEAPKAIYRGLAATYFPARFEILSRNPLVIFDGAHNISGFKTLSENINRLLSDKKITLVCGMLRDKMPEAALPEILNLPQVVKFIAVPIDSARAIPPSELCDIASKYFKSKDCEYIETLEDMHAIRKIKEANAEAIICFGSLFLANVIKNLFSK